MAVHSVDVHVHIGEVQVIGLLSIPDELTPSGAHFIADGGNICPLVE